MTNRSNSWATLLLKTEMRRQLNRLDASARDRALRKALARKRGSSAASGWDPVANPCPWWSPQSEAEHHAWLEAPVPEPVLYEELDPCRTWAAGQPVLLCTQGVAHTAYVRLEGANFSPRWLAGTIPERRVSSAALTVRDPREVWSDPYELQLAQALLSAERNPWCAWLAGPYDVDEEPELEALYALAVEELARRDDPPTGPAPVLNPDPPTQRAWLRTEVDAMRSLGQHIETVDLAPGR